jgi:hypothetical protein
MSRPRGANLAPAAFRLEPTFSLTEVGAHLGLGHSAVAELVSFGLKYGAKLHPQRGGLWPTFKGAKARRVPLSAIERHKRHMSRLDGVQDLPPTKLVDVKFAEVEEVPHG